MLDQKDPTLCWIKMLPFCENYHFQESTMERGAETSRAMQCDSARRTSLARVSPTVSKFCCIGRTSQLPAYKAKGLVLPDKKYY